MNAHDVQTQEPRGEPEAPKMSGKAKFNQDDDTLSPAGLKESLNSMLSEKLPWDPQD